MTLQPSKIIAWATDEDPPRVASDSTKQCMPRSSRESFCIPLCAALASQAQPEQPKQDSVHLTSDAVVCAATAQPVAWARQRFICDRDGRPIGTDDPELAWGDEPPDDSDWLPLYGSAEESVAALPVQPEPEFFTIFAKHEGGWIPLPGYSNETEKGVKDLVLQTARREGYKGTVAGRLLDLGWRVGPVYALPPPPADQGAPHG